MRFTTLLILALFLLSFSACGGSDFRANQSEQKTVESGKAPTQLSGKAPTQLQGQNDSMTTEQLRRGETVQLPKTDVSLNQAGAANAASQAIERKIIRNANLTLEVASPTESQRKIFSAAEAQGGIVVTSEMTQQTSDDKSKPEVSVNLVVRVPALQFDQVMEEIRGVANRVLQEKRTGQDVTEEFIDLEARIKNQKALEVQFLE